LGFYLGQSTANRHHALKDHKRLQNEILHRPHGENDVEKIESALVSVASEKLLSTNFNEAYNEKFEEYNIRLRDHFSNCIHQTFFNTSMDSLEGFLGHLVQEEYSSFVKCSDDLNTFLQNLN
jgi:hypothetical protein